MTAVALTLPNGKPVKLRRIQMTVWGAVAAFLGAGFIAGLYFGIFEVNWHVFYLKPWWDHLFTEGWWPVYRHTAFRDIPEPAFAAMGVKTLMAAPKYWGKRVGTARLVITPFVIIALTLILGVAGTWLLNYGLPLHVRNGLSWHSAGELILGVVIGLVLHRIWAPVGSTIQGHLSESAAEKGLRRRHIPVWVKLPLAPPVVRERFNVNYKLFKAARLNETAPPMDRPSRGKAWAITGIVILFVLITALGIVAHYYVGAGHSLPWLTNP
jgi:hypothetical protein